MVGDELEAIRGAKKRAKGRLFAISGVHAVGIGPKQAGGQPTSEPAIIVYVLEKKPLESIPADQVIPSEIEGFKTDVVQSAIPTQAVDDVGEVNDNKRERPLIGGTQMQVALARSSGTLGFFAIQDTPNGEVVAVTNWHVVAPGNGTKTNLVLTSTAGPGAVALRFATSDTNPIPAGTVAYFSLHDFPTAPTGFDFYVQSISSDTPANLASRLRDQINALAAPGIVATLSGSTIVNITTNNAPSFLARPYGPTRPDPNCELHATATGNTVSISGAVPGDGYGLFVSVNFSSAEHATDSVFLTIPKGQTPETIVSRLAVAWRDRNPAFTATVNGRSVELSPGSQIDIFAWRDIRAGQPSNNLATGCCDCCPDDLGPTVAADYGLDAALVLLDSNRVSEYLAEVKGVGYIVGSHTVTDAEIMAPYVVTKRGMKSGRRTGIVEALDVDGILAPDIHVPGLPANQQPPDYSPRKFDGAMRIRSFNTSPTIDTQFSNRGDSGSAILREVTSGGYEVVGLLFGGVHLTPTSPPGLVPYTLATPIQPILDRFNIAVSTATGLDQAKPVPERQGARRAARTPSSQNQTPVREIRERVRALEEQLSVTTTGRAHVSAVSRHVREVNALVNGNRRVGVAWQRNGGPIIVGRFVQALRDPDCPLPSDIMGETWEQRLIKIAAALRPHASDALARELEGPTWGFLLRLGGKSARDVLDLCHQADRSILRAPEIASSHESSMPLPPPAE